MYLILELEVELAGGVGNALESLLPLTPANLHLTQASVTQMAAKIN